MLEVDTKDSMSLVHASGEELLNAFKKLDWYFDYGPKVNRVDYLEKISNLMLEIRSRKITGEQLTARELFDFNS